MRNAIRSEIGFMEKLVHAEEEGSGKDSVKLRINLMGKLRFFILINLKEIGKGKTETKGLPIARSVETLFLGKLSQNS